MMHDTLNNMPELQEDEQTIVSTCVFNPPQRMGYEAFADKKEVAA